MTILSLKIRVKELETKLQDWTEWAQQKVMQAARRLSKDLAELKALQQAGEEMLHLKKDQKALEDSTMKKLAEMESALKKSSGQVDPANAAVQRLENENAEVRAEMEAAKLNLAESIAICQEIANGRRKV
jgi:chromosome segregation ATPase